MGNVIWHANKMLPRIMQRGSRRIRGRRGSRSSTACCTRSQDVADMWQEKEQEKGEQEQPLSSQVFAHVVQMKLKFALTV